MLHGVTTGGQMLLNFHQHSWVDSVALQDYNNQYSLNQKHLGVGGVGESEGETDSWLVGERLRNMWVLPVSVSQGRICSDKFMCCHTEIEVADQTFHLTQSQYTDTGPTSPSTDPTASDAWHGSHWSTNFCHWYDLTPEKSSRKWDTNPGSSALKADAVTTRRTRRSDRQIEGVRQGKNRGREEKR